MSRWWRGTFGLVALVATGFALATLAIGVFVFETTHEALEMQLSHRIAVETQALIAEGRGGPLGIAKAIRRRNLARSTSSLDYHLVDSAGRTLAGSVSLPVPTMPGYVELLPFIVNGQARIAQSLTTSIPGGSRLLVAADRSAIDAIDATVIRLFVVAFGAMLLLGVGAAWFVGLVTRRRLDRIERTALAIIDGDLTRRVPGAGNADEFARVAAALNRMLDRIAALMDNLKQVSSDVAHDLRTPLTRLHNRLEEALTSDDRNYQRSAIEAASAETRELLDVFAALLRIAEVEGLGARAHFADVDLSAFVSDLVETYRPAMEASGHHIETQIAPDVTVAGDRRLLQRLLANLLDNAIVHTPTGTSVSVTLTSIAETPILTVSDDGPGVSPDEADTLLRRFARADRSRSTAGHGLGLAMVAAVAAAHHADVSITARPGFAVRLAFVGTSLATA